MNTWKLLGRESTTAQPITVDSSLINKKNLKTKASDI